MTVTVSVQATAEGTSEELAVRRSVALTAEHGDAALRALISFLPELDAELGALVEERWRAAGMARAAELRAKREAMAREITLADEELAQLAAKGFVIVGESAPRGPTATLSETKLAVTAAAVRDDNSMHVALGVLS